tara:strand:- start:954 stop:1247 length:294 start_codon:yes stop_codon:yes gene_type:complete
MDIHKKPYEQNKNHYELYIKKYRENPEYMKYVKDYYKDYYKYVNCKNLQESYLKKVSTPEGKEKYNEQCKINQKAYRDRIKAKKLKEQEELNNSITV